MATRTFPLNRARAFWLHRQGLATARGGAIDQVVASTGWLRTLGGVDVYLAARARSPGMRRADLDAAVSAGRLKVSMAVRGCIYLVPAAEVPTLLAEVTEGWRKGAARDLEKVGSSWKVIDRLADAIVGVLGSQALTTDAIRRALPDGAIKSFGDAGKQAGVSSPLPIALRVLELAGRIERSLEGGRLDTERYQWRVPAKPLAAASTDPLVRRARIAEAFLAQAGPATLGQLQCWTTWSQRDARAALEGVETATVAITGMADDALILKRDLDALEATRDPAGTVSLLSFEDNYLVLHDGPGIVADPRHHGRRVEQWGSSAAATLGTAQHLAHRTIILDGMVAGMWEVDPAGGGGVWQTFDPVPTKQKDALAAAVDDTARFLMTDVGHARAFSLDTMEEVQRRADVIKRGAKPAKAAKPVAKKSTKTTARAAAPAKKSTAKKKKR
jgi:hypothetical protein